MYKIGDQFINSSSGEIIKITSIRPNGSFEVQGNRSPLFWFVDACVLTSSTWASLRSSFPVEQSIKTCDCGLKFAKDGGKHSDWCSVKNDNL